MDSLMQSLQTGTIAPSTFATLEADFDFYRSAVNIYNLLAYIIYLQQRIIALETFANITPPAPPAGMS